MSNTPNTPEPVPNHPTFRPMPSPAISQSATFSPDRIGCNKNYFLSIDGILRIVIIVNNFTKSIIN